MLTHFLIRRRQSFADNHEFGAACAYEIVAGEVRGEVTPNDPRNACIVNLANAPRNERGAVEYRCDIHILRPKDLDKGNRRILYEAPNRGSKRGLMFLNDAPECNDPVSLEHAGNGFLMRHGYTWVTSGWQGDLVPWKDGMALAVPVATDHGQPIQRRVRTEICVNRPGVRSQPLSGDPRVRSYAAATLDNAHAELTVRMQSYGERHVIPSSDWAFATEENADRGGAPAVTPSASHLHLPGGFTPGAIYELVYTARDPLVLGLGFAAVRDLVSFLRYRKDDGAGNPNPLAEGTGVEKTYAWGRSQSGRFLRDLVYQGFNEDEEGQPVFDAIAPHAAGGGRMFLNYEFARPVTSCQQHTNQLEPELFPFAYNVMEDPQTGRKDGILKRPATDPLVIHTQTSTEYWQKRGSLAHTDGRGNDVPLPDRVRVYLMASTQHNAPYGTQVARGKTRHPNNPLPIGPALRALIAAMDRWATDGTAPPPSHIPRNADGTQVDPESLRNGFPAIPGGGCTGLHNRQLFLDYGEGLARGVIDARPKPPPDGAGYTVLVPAVDADGNDVPGIRLPWITVPLATYTGWNLQSEELAEGELSGLLGSSIPFPRTRAEREAGGDPRLSLEERYRDVDDYLQQIRTEIESLVQASLMLAEDTDALVTDCRQAFLNGVTDDPDQGT
ncbi:MAG: alpha/beta hydrolase domain-containing protein [Deltaproteobacteria bacterium]|nr:alpha/beta hydrolase domain-containing protein [Deltaproteobacteria bacterium]